MTKHYPLTGIHKYAMLAAKAALAAHKQGRYAEFHASLFRNYKRLNEESIAKIAGELNLDMESFKRDWNSSEIEKLIERDRREGKRIGVRSVPSVFINGRLLKNRSVAGFRDMIERLLKEKGGES